MHRRTFLVGAGGSTLAGLAGCAGIVEEDESGDDGSGDGNSTEGQAENDDGRSIVRIEAEGAAAPAISGDGELLAYASGGGEEIVVEEVASRETVHEVALEAKPDGHTNGGVAFSPDGQFLVVLNSGGDARTVHAIETETWERVVVDSYRSWAAGGLAFSPDGEQLAVGRGNGNVLLYDVGEWERTDVVDGADWRSYDQAYGTEYFVHTNDDGPHVYRYPDYELVHQFEGDANHGVAVSPDDRYVVCNQPREGATGELQPEDWVVTVVETEEWTTAARIEDVHGTANDVAFAGSDELVLSNRHDDEVLRYAVDDWSLEETYTAETESAWLRGRSIATTADTIAVAWDTSSQE